VTLSTGSHELDADPLFLAPERAATKALAINEQIEPVRDISRGRKF
jgi:hypothetical protein